MRVGWILKAGDFLRGSAELSAALRLLLLVLFLQEQEKYEEEPFAKFQFVNQFSLAGREKSREARLPQKSMEKRFSTPILILEKRKGGTDMVRIEPVLYLDVQQAVPLAFCPVCGAECYGSELPCLRCERRAK